MKRLILASKQSKHITTHKRPVVDTPLIGKGVIINSADGTRWMGVVKQALKGELKVKVAPAAFRNHAFVSDWNGDTEVDRESMIVLSDMPVLSSKIAEWDTRAEFDTKKVTITDEKSGKIVDYQNVTINGYLSTFENFTKSDRDGDYVRKEAFNKSLRTFMDNPVMLMDHDQQLKSMAGSFSSVSPDANGLRVIGNVSNAPGLIDVRFMIAEKHLKTLSMGGLFIYGPDGKAINEVELLEGSLVTVPSNQDAIFTVRTLDIVGSSKCYSRAMITNKGELRGH